MAVVDLVVPEGDAVALFVLTDGSNAQTPVVELTALRSLGQQVGVAVAVVAQPWQVTGHKPPPKPVQDAAWIEAVTTIRGSGELGEVPLIVAGRGNGARLVFRTARSVGACAAVAIGYRSMGTSMPAELAGTGLPTVVIPPSAHDVARLVIFDFIVNDLLVAESDED
jgi:predicted alpha/beta-hydrolase family hydrolase